jgi:hypothetical protein
LYPSTNVVTVNKCQRRQEGWSKQHAYKKRIFHTTSAGHYIEMGNLRYVRVVARTKKT